MRTKHVVEYAALRLVAGLWGRLPYRWALGLAWGVAWIGHYGVRFRRAEARRRIRAVFGDSISEARVRRIAWISWRNLSFNAVEIARFPRLRRRWLDRHTEFSELAGMRRATAGGRGAVIAVPHAGNWDLAGIVTHRSGLPVFFVARRQKNPLADAWLNRMRAATGAVTVWNDAHLLRTVLRRLREGGLLAILPDVRARSGAVTVPFLNGRADLGPGTAVFARQTGVPIIPAIAQREGWTRHRLRVFDPIEHDPALDKAADIERLTRAVAAVLDRAILDAPEQYFWYNKRWVLDPLERTAAPPPPPEAADAPSPA